MATFNDSRTDRYHLGIELYCNIKQALCPNTCDVGLLRAYLPDDQLRNIQRVEFVHISKPDTPIGCSLVFVLQIFRIESVFDRNKSWERLVESGWSLEHPSTMSFPLSFLFL